MPGPPITPEERAEAIRKINEILLKGKYEDQSRFNTIDHYTPPIENSSSNHPLSYKDDPIGSFAQTVFKAQNPDLYNKISSIGIGSTALDRGTVGETWRSPVNNRPAISIVHSSKRLEPFPDTMSTLRHEFGHVMGLKDYPEEGEGPSSYDMGDWSDMLNRDIQLPSVTPTKKVKVR